MGYEPSPSLIIWPFSWSIQGFMLLSLVMSSEATLEEMDGCAHSLECIASYWRVIWLIIGLASLAYLLTLAWTCWISKIADRVRKKYCYLCEDLVAKIYWNNGSHRHQCQQNRMHKNFLDRLPTPYASIICPDCSQRLKLWPANRGQLYFTCDGDNCIYEGYEIKNTGDTRYNCFLHDFNLCKGCVDRVLNKPRQTLSSTSSSLSTTNRDSSNPTVLPQQQHINNKSKFQSHHLYHKTTSEVPHYATGHHPVSLPGPGSHQSMQSRINHPAIINPVRPARKVKLRSSDTTPADSADESESAYPARLRVLKTGSNTPIDYSGDEAPGRNVVPVPLPKLVKKSRQNASCIEMNRPPAIVNKQSPISSTVSTVSTINEEINKQLHRRSSAASSNIVVVEEEIPSNQRNKNVNIQEEEAVEIPSNQNNQQKDVNKQLPVTVDTVEVISEDQSKWSRSNSYANAVDI